MRKSFAMFAVLFTLLSASITRAELLISETFEGPNTFSYWDGSAWKPLSNFVGSGFAAMYSDPKTLLGKETAGCHGGNQCIRLYEESEGGTSEFWSNAFNPTRSELWTTWWEKISSTYDINEGHKWFLMQCESSGDDPYISWQSWDGGTDKELSSRVYNSGPIACSDQTFAPSIATTLPSNQWYQYKVHIKLNTIGKNDGFFQVWIKKDGLNWTNLWNLQNVGNIRCNAARNIIALRFGGTRQRASGESSHGTKWIDDIKIGTTEADVDSGTNPVPLTPSAPENLRLNN